MISKGNAVCRWRYRIRYPHVASYVVERVAARLLFLTKTTYVRLVLSLHLNEFIELKYIGGIVVVWVIG